MSASLSGRRVGNFQVGLLVGAGGMGEVYRARDTKLNRDVAIKMLLPAVAADAERLARFSREAQVLASLNHPNIAHIHGLEDSDSGPLLVLEFVDGPTLADRIAQGPIAVEDAIAIARQIADALEAAHERGIIHRDLKPANIKVAGDGTVKVLDFGLAKALDPGAANREPGADVNSPTITTPAMTQAGLILGTAAYMSPEQAKGRVVDKRSDVWAFGCVLFEMLTARRAFGGEDVTDTIAAIVRGEPEWGALPPDTPPQIRLLLRRCLEKDRKARIPDIGVARFLMNERIVDVAAIAPVVPRMSRVVVAAALVGGGLLGAATMIGAWLALKPAAPLIAPVRFTITPPASQPLVLQGNDHDLALAPDGTFIVYRGGDPILKRAQLMVRGTNELEGRILPGTANARYPFVSADSKWVGFQIGGEIWKVAVSGGPATRICRIDGTPRGMSWGDDDVIVFGSPEGLRRVPASGGDPKELTTVDSTKPEQHVLPHVLPGSKWAVFTVFPGTDYLAARLEAIDLTTLQRKPVLPAGHDAAYVDSGHLVYGLTNITSEERFRASLRAVRFDRERAEPIGEPVTVIDSVRVGATPAVNYAVSRRGDLAFVSAGAGAVAAPVRSLVWVNRKGQETAIAAPTHSYAMVRISPDATRLALDVRDQTNDMWIWDINRQTLSAVNRHDSLDLSPLWTRDGRRIIWSSTRGGGNPNLYWQAADGTGAPERLTVSSSNQFPTSITPDGNTILVFGAGRNAAAAMDLFTINLKDPAHKAEPLVAAGGFDFGGEVSPDGKWLAYHSNESGEFQVYVRPFPNVQDGRSQISNAGGTRAVWAKNGRELFYLDRAGLLTAVTVQAQGTTFTAGAPVKILSTKYYLGATSLGLDLRSYDVFPDGQRFVMIKDDESERAPAPLVSMVVVLNWSEELRQRLPDR